MTSLQGVTVAFDLDGTLVDTAPDLAATLDVILAGEGLPPLGLAAARAYVGHGAAALLRQGFQAAGTTLPPAKEAELVTAFVTHYQGRIAEASRPFPHVETCLVALRAAGANLVVCTNKRTGLSEQLLGALGLDQQFKAVIGQDSVPARKPDAGHLLTSLAAVGGTPGRSLFLGDSDTDVQTGLNAQVPVGLFTGGYAVEAGRALGPDFEFSDFAEIPGIVHSLMA